MWCRRTAKKFGIHSQVVPVETQCTAWEHAIGKVAVEHVEATLVLKDVVEVRIDQSCLVELEAVDIQLDVI